MQPIRWKKLSAVIGILIVTGIVFATRFLTPLILPPFDYDSAWKRVELYEKKGYIQTAIQATDSIINVAQAEDNNPQTVKGFIFRFKYKETISDSTIFENLREVDAQIAKAQPVLKSIFYSIKGSMLLQYYQQNKWLIDSRSVTVNFVPEDISTYSIPDFEKAILEAFSASVKPVAALQKEPFKKYAAFIKHPEDSLAEFPDLYTFLAKRACEQVGQMAREQTYTDGTAFRNPGLLSSVKSFLKTDVSGTDSNSVAFWLVNHYKTVLTHTIDANQQESVVLFAKMAFDFVHQFMKIPEKHNLYLRGLQKLAQDYPTAKNRPMILLAIGQKLEALGGLYQYTDSTTHAYRLSLKAAVDAYSGLVAAYPNAPESAVAQNAIQRLTHAYVNTKHLFHIQPQQKILVELKYKNVKTVTVQVYPIHYQEYRGLQEDNVHDTVIISKIQSGKPIQTQELTLIEDGDLQEHATEFMLNELNGGTYALVVTQKDAVNPATVYSFMNVTNLLWTSLKTDVSQGQEMIRVTQASSGKPIEKAVVELYARQYNSSKRKSEKVLRHTLRTDAQGLATFNASTRYESFEVVIRTKEDVYWGEQSWYVYGKENDDYEGATYRTLFFLDRSIYRPGQTVHFKALVTDGKEGRTIKPGKEITVALKDANYQQVASITLRTNAMGSASGSFVLPNGGLTGQYFLEELNGNQYFSVEEYKRPKFEVKAEPLQGSYRLNDSIDVTFSAQALAGYAIDQAKVTYRITRSASLPIWWTYYKRSYAYEPPFELVQGTGVTNAAGIFKIRFKAVAPDGYNPQEPVTYTYDVEVSVTDATGETSSYTEHISVSQQALQLSVTLPDVVEKNDTTGYLIVAKNTAGNAEDAQGKIRIHRIKPLPAIPFDVYWPKPDRPVLSPTVYATYFGGITYEGTAFTSRELGELVYEVPFNTAQKSKLRFKEAYLITPGEYRITVESTDKYGQKVLFTKDLVVFAKNQAQVPTQEGLWSYLEDKAYEPGTNARIWIGSAAEPAHVWVGAYTQKGQILQWNKVVGKNIQTLDIPIEEKHRGGITVLLLTVKNGKVYQKNHSINVPWTPQKLQLQLITSRDKTLPGASETWKLAVKGSSGERVTAELLAGMYDQSLEAFTPHTWFLNPYQELFVSAFWEGADAHMVASTHARYWPIRYQKVRTYQRPEMLYYDNLFYGYDVYWSGYDYDSDDREMVLMGGTPANYGDKDVEFTMSQTNKLMEEQNVIAGIFKITVRNDSSLETIQQKLVENPPAAPRANFNETAFFYPQLTANEQGEYIIDFKMPEALTAWKFKALAHTADLKTGYLEHTVITQKQLMITSFSPRFFRQGDRVVLTAKITNLTDKPQTVDAGLAIEDAILLNPITSWGGTAKQTVTIEPAQSKQVQWSVQVSDLVDAVNITFSASNALHQDAEQLTIPVLTNRMLVTESVPMHLNGKGSAQFNFTKLKQSGSSKTLKHHQLVLEFTSNPAWYAVQTLPYLMEYPYECAEQTFSRLYANALAAYVVQTNPKIKAVFEVWKNFQPQALQSALDKNPDLKNTILSETPWVRDAANEREQKQRLAFLMDADRMQRELKTSIVKLRRMQLQNGGWPWFDGGPDNLYITQHILAGFGKLQRLGVTTAHPTVTDMVKEAIQYLDARLEEEYQEMVRNKVDLTTNHLNNQRMMTLYARSFFDTEFYPLPGSPAMEFYKTQLKQYGLQSDAYFTGMNALTLHRMGFTALAQELLRALRETSIDNKELGRYWKHNTGYYWFEAPVERQALLIEVFHELKAPVLEKNQLQHYLLKHKQTNAWATTKATADAVYALLLDNTQWLSTESNVQFTLGQTMYNPQMDADAALEAGTGYVKKSWAGTAIQPAMGSISVTKNTDGVSWGAVYWQYFEQLDKITPAQTPLRLTKTLMLQKITKQGVVNEPITNETVLKPGDRVVVRVAVFTDRPMEFVHLKDMRASGFEPENVLSGYRYQQGIGYYESTRDAATHFFIDYLPKGSYVFEYPVRITHAGTFSNGITQIQCMYAPEFAAHSAGVLVSVTN